MADSETNKGRKGKRKRRPGGEGQKHSGQAGLLISIVTGVGLGALIGLITGYFLSPKSRESSPSEPGQALRAWREMVRKLSEQLQARGVK